MTVARRNTGHRHVIVPGTGVNAKTIPELIALAKVKPGALNFSHWSQEPHQGNFL